jgi:hypothetical protein
VLSEPPRVLEAVAHGDADCVSDCFALPVARGDCDCIAVPLGMDAVADVEPVNDAVAVRVNRTLGDTEELPEALSDGCALRVSNPLTEEVPLETPLWLKGVIVGVIESCALPEPGSSEGDAEPLGVEEVHAVLEGAPVAVPGVALLVPLLLASVVALALPESLLEPHVLERRGVPLSRSDAAEVNVGSAFVAVGEKVVAHVKVVREEIEDVGDGEAEGEVEVRMERVPVVNREATAVGDTRITEEEGVCEEVTLSVPESDQVTVGDSDGEPDTEGDELGEPDGESDAVGRTLYVCETVLVCESAEDRDAHWLAVSEKENVAEGVRDGEPLTDCEALIVPLMEGVPDVHKVGLIEEERLPVKETVTVAQSDAKRETVAQEENDIEAEEQPLALAAGEFVKEGEPVTDRVALNVPLSESVPEEHRVGLIDGERLPVKETEIVALLDATEKVAKEEGVWVAEEQLLALAASELEARALEVRDGDGAPLVLCDAEPVVLAAPVNEEVTVEEFIEENEGKEEKDAEWLSEGLVEATGDELILGLWELDAQWVGGGERETEALVEGKLCEGSDDTEGEREEDTLRVSSDAVGLFEELKHGTMEGVGIPSRVIIEDTLLLTSEEMLGDDDALKDIKLALTRADGVAVPKLDTLTLAETDAQDEGKEEALALGLPEVEPLLLAVRVAVGQTVGVRLLVAQLLALAVSVRKLRDGVTETESVERGLAETDAKALTVALFEAWAEAETEGEADTEKVPTPLLDGLEVAERQATTLPEPLLLGRGEAELLGEPVIKLEADIEAEGDVEGEPD